MARGLRLGEKVKRVGSTSYEQVGPDDKPTAVWDVAKCPTGTVAGIYNGGKGLSVSVLVQPDEEGGFGTFIVPVAQLERVKNAG